MGSVRQRLAEARHVCNVVLVGDVRVGKTALVNRFANAKFTEFYRATSVEKTTVMGNAAVTVANRKVNFVIWDTTGSHSAKSSRSSAYLKADVFLLCYKISDPASLYSALTHWCAEVRCSAPATPIVLVGCQSDLRSHRDVLSSLAKQGRAPVSAEQALSFCQQMGAATYVETSARQSANARNVNAVFEVAALASLGQLPRKTNSSSMRKQHYLTDSPDFPEPTDQLWDHLSQLRSSCPSSARSDSDCDGSLSSKTRSTSIPSISSGSKTPTAARRRACLPDHAHNNNKTMTIVCQRLTSDRTYEEIEVEVPAPIYETLQLYNNMATLPANSNNNGNNSKQRISIRNKIRNLFSSRH